MTESRTTEENSEKHVLSFGERLYIERKRQNLSVADVAAAIHLSEKVIDAIDRSDVTQLPQPTFVQGYLRAYARHLGLAEAPVLEEYAKAVPHKQEADLQPRSTLPDEASSSSPFVKMITVALLVMTAVAAIYASFSYYKNAIVSDEVEQESETALFLPETDLIEQGESDYEINPEPVESELVETVEIDILPDTVIQSDAEKEKAVEEVVIEAEQEAEELQEQADKEPINQLTAEGEDFLQLFAEQVSWVEVADANGVNLYYDLLQQGQSVTLKGTAPFKVFLGNAPVVKVVLNDVDANIAKHIRSNNIANFRISVDQQQVVFH